MNAITTFAPTLTTKDTHVFLGETYFAQLGNPEDSSGYVENAEIVIIMGDHSAVGANWIAVSKKPDGSPQFLFDVRKYRVINDKLYSTRACSMEKLEYHFDAEKVAEIKHQFQFHKTAFDALMPQGQERTPSISSETTMITNPTNAINVLDASAINNPMDIATLGGGKFVTAQLGNRFDTQWKPCSTILLLGSEATYSGNQYYGVYKTKDGQHYLAKHITIHSQHTHGRDLVDEHEPLSKNALVYCTSALPFDLETMTSDYIGEEEMARLKRSLSWHKAKIALLPAVEQYVRDQKVD